MSESTTDAYSADTERDFVNPELTQEQADAATDAALDNIFGGKTDTSPTYEPASNEPAYPDAEAKPEPKAEEKPAEEAAPASTSEDYKAGVLALAATGKTAAQIQSMSPEAVEAVGAVKLASAPAEEGTGEGSGSNGGPDTTGEQPRVDGKFVPEVPEALTEAFGEDEAKAIHASQVSAVQAQIGPVNQMVERLIGGFAELVADRMQDKLAETFPEVKDSETWGRVRAQADALGNAGIKLSPAQLYEMAAVSELGGKIRKEAAARNAKVEAAKRGETHNPGSAPKQRQDNTPAATEAEGLDRLMDNILDPMVRGTKSPAEVSEMARQGRFNG